MRTAVCGSWDELRSGWIRNLALLFPNTRELARKRSNEFLWLFFSLLLSLLATVSHSSHRGASDWVVTVALVFLWLFTLSNFAVFYSRVARAHFPLGATLLSVFGLPSFAKLLRQSAKAYEEGTVTWRGRACAAAGAESQAIASNLR